MPQATRPESLENTLMLLLINIIRFSVFTQRNFFELQHLKNNNLNTCLEIPHIEISYIFQKILYNEIIYFFNNNANKFKTSYFIKKNFTLIFQYFNYNLHIVSYLNYGFYINQNVFHLPLIGWPWTVVILLVIWYAFARRLVVPQLPYQVTRASMSTLLFILNLQVFFLRYI